MVTPEQYPYFLYQYQILASSRDEFGDFVSNGEDWVFLAKCRDETSTSQRKSNVQDGEAYKPDSVIQVEKHCEVVNVGSMIQVRDFEGNVRLEGKCTGFAKNAFNCRIWV